MSTELLEQGSPEWLAARLGRATASRFSDVLATIKSGESSQRRNYRAELVLERLTGETAESFSSSAMAWGNDTEDLARVAYTLRTGQDVETVGFFQHESLMAGASPDGFVGTDGAIEIKCKIPANHIETLKLNAMPAKHLAQVQGQLWITGRQWCDFVSFDPRFPANAQIFIQRIERDEQYIHKLMLEVTLFLDEVDEEVTFIKGYGTTQKPLVAKASNLEDLFDE